MKRIHLIASLSFLILLASLTSFSTEKEYSLIDDVLGQPSKFRRSKGLPALIINEELNAIAQQHSADMARGKVGFGHSGFSKRNSMAGKGIKPPNNFAESVAYGATSGKEVVTMWKNSSGHRRNMPGRYKYIGIGTAKDRGGHIYYTRIFAA